jgi:hypothetical protein
MLSAEGASVKRRLTVLTILAMAALLLLATLVPVALGAGTPTLTLKAASKSVAVGSPLKLTVTVASAQPPYEVRILKQTTKGTWVRAATATLVAPGKYTAYVTFTAKGTKHLKAAYVTASGAITAYSNTVTVNVK